MVPLQRFVDRLFGGIVELRPPFALRYRNDNVGGTTLCR